MEFPIVDLFGSDTVMLIESRDGEAHTRVFGHIETIKIDWDEVEDSEVYGREARYVIRDCAAIPDDVKAYLLKRIGDYWPDRDAGPAQPDDPDADDLSAAREDMPHATEDEVHEVAARRARERAGELVGKTINAVRSGITEGAYGEEPMTTLTFTDGTSHSFVHPPSD